ncbi:GNAT family N-acetyltransferase [bacterium]|nr:GNAT family N-acetyltransferase [bacterium]MBU1985193.1 GNAT family N-acetyltransferase [bacterium]
MRIELSKCVVRSWEESDAPSLARCANNRNISRNLRDAFPFPYTEDDARSFIEMARGRNPDTFFAIEVEGEAAGGIGYRLQGDIDRVAAVIGYWLAEPLWNRGIMTEALAAVTDYAIREHGLTRVYATPFEWNAASMRVLEKCGYLCEGRLRKRAIKDGKVIDLFMYAYVVNDER